MTPNAHGSSSRSHRFPRAIISAAAGVAVALGTLGAATPALAASTDDEYVVTWTQYLGVGEPLQEVQTQTCPRGMALQPHRYHQDTKWRMPRGLEIIQGGAHNSAFDADVKEHSTGTGVGGFGSTVSNWFGAAQTVTFKMHCVLR